MLVTARIVSDSFTPHDTHISSTQAVELSYAISSHLVSLMDTVGVVLKMYIATLLSRYDVLTMGRSDADSRTSQVTKQQLHALLQSC